MLTSENAGEYARRGAERLGASGRAARASNAAKARWNKGNPKPARDKLVPPLSLLLRWLDIAIEQERRAGWVIHRGKIAEAIAWLREQE